MKGSWESNIEKIRHLFVGEGSETTRACLSARPFKTVPGCGNEHIFQGWLVPRNGMYFS